MYDTVSNVKVKYNEEFNLQSKRGGANVHLLSAYANQEVTDYFEFNDKEDVFETDQEQIEIIREVESHVVKDSLITDYDLQIIGEGVDLDVYGASFDPEKSLYNLKKEIKVDASDLGAK